MNLKKILIFISLILILPTKDLISQNCYKKDLCKNAINKDYDYRSQSSYQTLSVGDTINTGFVAYADQDYHFLICAENKLGPIEIKIWTENKIVNKVIKEIISDANSNDTIYENKVKTEYELIFENTDDKSLNYWEFSSRKTRLLIVNITAPEGKNNYTGCANILIGNKLMATANRKLR